MAGKYSDDPAVEDAVLAAEAEYTEALEAFRADNGNPDLAEVYREKKVAFENARQAARADRPGMGIVAEGE